jgi:hypothetical protein
MNFFLNKILERISVTIVPRSRKNCVSRSWIEKRQDIVRFRSWGDSLKITK